MENSRPEASADLPSSFDTPRQRQIKLRVASILGQPRPIVRDMASAVAGRPYRPCFHIGLDGAEQRRGGAQQAQLTWHAAAQQPGNCRARGGGSAHCGVVGCAVGWWIWAGWAKP